MNEQIDEIIARKLAGEASGDDIRILDSWIAADSRNKAEYEQITKLWQQSTLLETVNFDTTAAWNKIESQTITKKVSNHGPGTIKLPVWTKYAIGLAAILLLGLFLMRPLTDRGVQKVVADAGNIDIVLPDNSHVTLRKGSTLSYPESFSSNERNVSLEGEAFFNVTRNEQKPFVIDAQSVSVKVLGTSFNVNCNAAFARVTVASGKVQMSSKSNQSKYVLLTKGEDGKFEHNTLSENMIEGDNYLFWKTGALQYDNKSLQYIVNELSYYYQKQIIVDTGMAVEMQNQSINISFKNQSVEEILNELCLIAGSRWQLKDNQYLIMAK